MTKSNETQTNVIIFTRDAKLRWLDVLEVRASSRRPYADHMTLRCVSQVVLAWIPPLVYPFGAIASRLVCLFFVPFVGINGKRLDTLIREHSESVETTGWIEESDAYCGCCAQFKHASALNLSTSPNLFIEELNVSRQDR